MTLSLVLAALTINAKRCNWFLVLIPASSSDTVKSKSGHLAVGVNVIKKKI
jgi:hypothetical protein